MMIDILVKSTGLDKETIIDLLPFILIEIRNYTNQYFLTTHHLKVEKIEDDEVYVNGNIEDNIQVGDCIELLNSENNVMLYFVKEITDNRITMEEELVDELNNDNIVMIKLSFKNLNFKTIESMLNYDVKFGKANGIKSQTLGGYSVTYASAEGGDTAYPVELYGGVNSLRKLNDDYAEYRRKGYVRL